MPRKYNRVTVGWRVMGSVIGRDGSKTLQAISRLFSSRGVAMDYVEIARRSGVDDAYLQEVQRPERKVMDIA